jgi:hypothetical protein
MILSDEALLSEVSNLEDRRYDAMLSSDVAYLSSVFDNGLMYTHSSGSRQNGADYLRGLTEGHSLYHTISHGIDRIVRLPDSLLVYGWNRIREETDGVMRELDNLSLVVLSRVREGWKLAAYVSTPRGHPSAPAREQ